LLSLKEKEKIAQLFHVAKSLRQRYFGSKVFLYSFIYFVKKDVRLLKQ